MLISCPECNEKVSDKVRVCPHCGFQIDTLMKCPDCGKLVRPGTTACPSCGYLFTHLATAAPMFSRTSDSVVKPEAREIASPPETASSLLLTGSGEPAAQGNGVPSSPTDNSDENSGPANRPLLVLSANSYKWIGVWSAFFGVMQAFASCSVLSEADPSHGTATGGEAGVAAFKFGIFIGFAMWLVLGISIMVVRRAKTNRVLSWLACFYWLYLAFVLWGPGRWTAGTILNWMDVVLFLPGPAAIIFLLLTRHSPVVGEHNTDTDASLAADDRRKWRYWDKARRAPSALLSTNEIRERIADGRLSPADQLWAQGADKWRPASEYEAFGSRKESVNQDQPGS